MAVKQRDVNIYLSLMHLINPPRDRAARSLAKPSDLGSQPCVAVDAKVLRSLQMVVRPHLQQCGRIRSSGRRLCKKRQNRRRRSRPLQHGGHRVQHMLRSLDSDRIISPEDALSAVCSDNRLFLSKCQSLVGTVSMKEALRALVVVSEAVNVLYTARTQYDASFLIAQGAEIGLLIDDTFIANYEHLVWRLESEIIATLLGLAAEASIPSGRNQTQRKLLDWFSEFPNCQRPLSTTWPWSIKPSLAVLWGVCWMFYDSQRRSNGNRIPQARLLQDEQVAAAWPPPQPDEYYNFGLQLLNGSDSPSGAPQRAGPGGSPFGSGRHSPARSRLTGNESRGGAQPHFGQGQGSGNVDPGPRPAARAAYYPLDFPPAGRRGNAGNDSIPDFQGLATSQSPIAFQHQHFGFHLDDTWAYTQPNLPHRAGRLIDPNPSITVTDGNAQPHLDFRNPYLPRQHPRALNTGLSNHGNQPYAMGASPHLEPSSTTTQILRHDRTPSLHSTPSMPTPVSIGAGNSPRLSPVDDNRRHSLVSSPGHLPPRSEGGSSLDGDDEELSARRTIQYRRTGEPPRNDSGKMYCDHKGCSGITFERKCEWSKHMDKHERPYKCKAPGCEKLQGFTYSGGLLRHEREVHKLHGGTKKSLFCPIETCKRSTGSGFTRKENLHEHIRRVHRGNSTSSDLGHLLLPESQDDANGAHVLSKAQSQGTSEYQNVDRGVKRKQLSDASVPGDDPRTALEAENKRLRSENEELLARVRHMQERLSAFEQGQR